jgi:sugar/nucleoside kinase (ribokinase family)
MAAKQVSARPGKTPRNDRPTVVGAGLIALDVVIDDLTSVDAAVYAGGTCGNVLAILSYLGWYSRAIGFVGRDVAGGRVLADLERIGVNCDHLVAIDEARTPIFLQRVVGANGNHLTHSFPTECPACGELLNREGIEALPTETFGLVTPDVFFVDRLSPSTLNLMLLARDLDVLVMYEPSTPSDARYWSEALPLVDILKYSADRFSPLDFEHARRGRLSCVEVQTAGEQGLRFRGHQANHSWRHMDAVPASRVVDTCGAGDWCTAGFLAALANGEHGARLATDEQIADALRAGQTFSSWACGFVGARGGMYDARAHSQLDSAVPSQVAPQPLLDGGLCGRPTCRPIRRSAGS